MAASSKLSPLLNELALALELPPPTGGEKHRPFRLDIGSFYTLEFREHTKGFSFWSRITEAPPKNKEDFYLLIMRANFLGQGTGGNVIGLDQEEKNLTLSSYIPYEMDFRKFKETIEDFINFIDYWKDERDQYIAQADRPFIT